MAASDSISTSGSIVLFVLELLPLPPGLKGCCPGSSPLDIETPRREAIDGLIMLRIALAISSSESVVARSDRPLSISSRLTWRQIALPKACRVRRSIWARIAPLLMGRLR
jgi:hypothetical protein